MDGFKLDLCLKVLSIINEIDELGDSEEAGDPRAVEKVVAKIPENLCPAVELLLSGYWGGFREGYVAMLEEEYKASHPIANNVAEKGKGKDDGHNGKGPDFFDVSQVKSFHDDSKEAGDIGATDHAMAHVAHSTGKGSDGSDVNQRKRAHQDSKGPGDSVGSPELNNDSQVKRVRVE